MSINRQPIAEALLAIIRRMEWSMGAGTQTWAETGDRLKMWGECQQPAAFLVEHDEQSVQKTGMPYRCVLQFKVVIYQDTAQDRSVSGAVLNRKMQEAFEKVIAPLPSDPGHREERNTLGGLCHHVWVEGSTFKDGGDLDGQAVLVIPVNVLVP